LPSQLFTARQHTDRRGQHPRIAGPGDTSSLPNVAEPKPSTASDMYAFGIVVCEVRMHSECYSIQWLRNGLGSSDLITMMSHLVWNDQKPLVHCGTETHANKNPRAGLLLPTPGNESLPPTRRIPKTSPLTSITSSSTFGSSPPLIVERCLTSTTLKLGHSQFRQPDPPSPPIHQVGHLQQQYQLTLGTQFPSMSAEQGSVH